MVPAQGETQSPVEQKESLRLAPPLPQSSPLQPPGSRWGLHLWLQLHLLLDPRISYLPASRTRPSGYPTSTANSARLELNPVSLPHVPLQWAAPSPVRPVEPVTNAKTPGVTQIPPAPSLPRWGLTTSCSFFLLTSPPTGPPLNLHSHPGSISHVDKCSSLLRGFFPFSLKTRSRRVTPLSKALQSLADGQTHSPME